MRPGSTLPLSMSGILLGSAIAYGQGAFRWDIFLLALLTTVLFQVLSDYANDYGDAQKGTDNEHRIGPKRAIQTGAMSLGEMKWVVVVTAVLSAISALSLIVLSFREQWGLALIFVLLGGAAIFAAIEVAKKLGAGKKVLALAPDNGERYLSTALYEFDA